MKLATQLFAGLALAAMLIANAVAGEGKVVSAINTDMYTYVEVSANDKTVWVAGPLITTKPGDNVSFDNGMMMTNFFSKQLQRTFPSVMFVQRLAVVPEK